MACRRRRSMSELDSEEVNVIRGIGFTFSDTELKCSLFLAKNEKKKNKKLQNWVAAVHPSPVAPCNPSTARRLAPASLGFPLAFHGGRW